jgi:hypothetical protein
MPAQDLKYVYNSGLKEKLEEVSQYLEAYSCPNS